MNTKQKRILVVEDDSDINNLIRAILVKQGFGVEQSFSGTEGKLQLELHSFDLVILDLMLPGMTGEALIHVIREEEKKDIPVLILSAKNSLKDKVQLLSDGADDYLTKPFEPEELLARVIAVLRRSESKSLRGETEIYQYKELILNPAAREVRVKNQRVELTPYEYEILLLLLQSPEKVFSRETLYEKVWSNGYYGEDNTVNVHVSNLRKKIAIIAPKEEYIKTVWGIGFKMA
jgi:DNA-binding response OmpR family regulator